MIFLLTSLPSPLAKFVTSAAGRCHFPLAIYGEGVADRPGVRSNVRVLSPTGEIAHERSRIERSEIGVARARIGFADRAIKARIERSEIGRPKDAFSSV